MYTCDNNHEKIVHLTHQCPLCDTMKELEDTQADRDDFKEEAKELRGRVAELEAEE